MVEGGRESIWVGTTEYSTGYHCFNRLIVSSKYGVTNGVRPADSSFNTESKNNFPLWRVASINQRAYSSL